MGGCPTCCQPLLLPASVPPTPIWDTSAGRESLALGGNTLCWRSVLRPVCSLPPTPNGSLIPVPEWGTGSGLEETRGCGWERTHLM